MADNKEFDPLKQAFLDAFPNPDRVGCPDQKTLKAIGRKHLPLNHPAQIHVSGCSPCFKEVLEYQAQWQTNRRRTHILLAVAGLLSIAALAKWWETKIYNVPTQTVASHVALPSPQKRVIPEVATLVALNFHQIARQRGADAVRVEKAQHIPARLVTLNITLPIGSDDGQYQVEIRTRDNQVFKRASGSSRIENGNTVLTVPNLELSSIPAGHYLLFFHHADASWRHASILIDEPPSDLKGHQ